MIFLVIIGYALINLVFNYHVYWHQLVVDMSKTGAVWGEVQAYEWLTDKFYKTILSGHNPFGMVQGFLYPFSFHLGLTDAANGFFFLFLRPFFSVHQSMSIIVTISLFFANIGMYLLLRSLKFNKIISFLMGLAYGYMTFLMPRGGHLNYWCIYLFPWFYYCIVNLLGSKKTWVKIISSMGISLFFVLALWLNFYYFIILIISIFCLICYFVIAKTKLFFRQIKEKWHYGIFIFLLILVFLLPWAKGLSEVMRFDEIPKTRGWGGAIDFSSDVFHYLAPSVYNYYYGRHIVKILNYFVFTQDIFENFTYPGIIILITYFFGVIFYKKIPKKITSNLLPYFITSLVFFILTLGPFLHVFGKWGIPLDGIRVVIPLPYMVLHYLPFLNNIRVPGRLVVGFIFFAYIVCAYIINYFLKNRSKKFKIFFFLVFFAIFIIDQRVVDNIFPPNQYSPYKIFKIIKSDPQRISVLEIPFTVRDGFTYFGDNGAIGMTIGESWHGKPVLGGYIGRMPDYKKYYYINNPFFGYLGRIIDTDIKHNPIIDQNDLINWTDLDVEKSKETIEFLGIKYIIVHEKKNYYASLSAKFKELGYLKKMTDKNYSLWEKTLKSNEFLSIDLGDPDDNLFLGMGWHIREDNYRWSDKKNSLMFKVLEKGKYNLEFEAQAFYKDIPVDIYVNEKKISRITVSVKQKKYTVPVTGNLIKGINFVNFIFDKSYQPFEVIPGSSDERQLSAKFFKINLIKRN